MFNGGLNSKYKCRQVYAVMIKKISYIVWFQREMWHLLASTTFQSCKQKTAVISWKRPIQTSLIKLYKVFLPGSHSERFLPACVLFHIPLGLRGIFLPWAQRLQACPRYQGEETGQGLPTFSWWSDGAPWLSWSTAQCLTAVPLE